MVAAAHPLAELIVMHEADREDVARIRLVFKMNLHLALFDIERLVVSE